MKKFISLAITVLLMSMFANGVISFNYTECAYTGECQDDGKIRSEGSINQLIIHGAGYFLESSSDFQLLLNRVELSELYGINFEELKGVLNTSIYNMEETKRTYFDLKNLAAATPYNQEIIEKLKTFDYYGFQQGKGFNAGIFLEVKSFLSKGNVTGAYESMFSKTAGLLERLNNIKKDIDNNIIPDIYRLWELNQKYSDALFFGQYAAMILKEMI